MLTSWGSGEDRVAPVNIENVDKLMSRIRTKMAQVSTAARRVSASALHNYTRNGGTGTCAEAARASTATTASAAAETAIPSGPDRADAGPECAAFTARLLRRLWHSAASGAAGSRPAAHADRTRRAAPAG